MATILGAVLARPEAPIPGRTIPIITFSETKDDSGQYNYVYSTGNGISAAERGALKPNAARTDNFITKEVSAHLLLYDTIYDKIIFIFTLIKR